jgi:hypothetical protein
MDLLHSSSLSADYLIRSVHEARLEFGMLTSRIFTIISGWVWEERPGVPPVRVGEGGGKVKEEDADVHSASVPSEVYCRNYALLLPI